MLVNSPSLQQHLSYLAYEEERLFVVQSLGDSHPCLMGPIACGPAGRQHIIARHDKEEELGPGSHDTLEGHVPEDLKACF